MEKSVAVRYCGGCNPMYDRYIFVSQLQDRFPEIALIPYDPKRDYQGILMICACEVACADYSGLPAGIPRMTVTTADDHEKAVDFLTDINKTE